MKTENQFDEHLPAVKIIGKFGGNAAFARALGKAPSTTYRHLRNGHFVGSDVGNLHREIIEAANELDIKLEPGDFVDLRLFEGEVAPA